MNISLANRLAALRRESNLSEDELSVFINVPTSRVYAWETAEAEPTASELFELSKLYHISIDELIKNEASVALEKPGSSDFIREKRPENFTDREIYPESPHKGVQFIGASKDGFFQAPYTKAEDIKPRDTSHVKFAEPESPNIKIKTAQEAPKQSANTAANGKGIDDLIGKIPPDVVGRISDALGKAGHIIGDTIDKVGDAIGRTSSEPSNPKSNTDKQQYTPPPNPYVPPDEEYEYAGQYYRNRAREKWNKKEEKWRAKDEKLRYKAERKARKKHRSLLYKTFPLLMLTLFFVFGAMGGWMWSWLMFLLIPIYYTLVEAIETGDLRRFAYPVAVVVAFMTSGFIFNNWGPASMMFLTIPFYYIITSHFKSKKDNDNENNNM
jgi:transcriptional regulator with XRE-family HTH domain